ncbi:MAG: type III secretion system outer membrane ring subunit SctC [Hydrogenophaga sp.]
MRWKAAMVLCAAVVLLPQAHAAPLPFDGSPYSYYANETPVAKMLAEFCANFGIQLQIDPGIATRMSGRLGAASASEFLNTVTASAGLDWFHYAGTIHVTRVSERDTQVHAIARETIPGLRSALLDLKMLDERFGWAALADQGMVVVSGPPAYLELIAKTMRTVQAAPNGQQMVVWKLKYANVEDRQVTIRDKTTVVPGVKTLLQALGGGRAHLAVGNIASSDGAVSRLEPLKPAPSLNSGAAGAASGSGQGAEAGVAVGSGGSSPTASTASDRTAGGRPQAFTGREVSIEADVRLNAIVMKGPADLIAGYQTLIAALDTPAGLVEIEAITIDVNKSRLEELGIDWSVNSRKLNLGFGDASLPVAAGVLSLGYRGAAAATTVVADQANALLARIRLLETTGDAYVAGKPSILTSDNLSALIDLSQTFYTKVTGERVANLTPVTVGVMLKVSPRIVTTEAGETEIQLVIDIEDGSLVDRTGLDLPVVQRTTISTQATIREGQSLLIGGYDTETQQNSMEKVPVLGDIPKLGALFRTTRVDQQRRKRMFLITPRIVSMGAPVASLSRSSPIPAEATVLQPLLRIDRSLGKFP